MTDTKTTATKTTARAEIYDAATSNHWKVVDVTEGWTHTTYGRGYGAPRNVHTLTRFVIEPDFSAGGEWGDGSRLTVLFTESDAFWGAFYSSRNHPVPDSRSLLHLGRNRLTKAQTLEHLRDENGPARKARFDDIAERRRRQKDRQLAAHDAAVAAQYNEALVLAMHRWEDIVLDIAAELPEGLGGSRRLAEAITAKIVGDDDNPGPVAKYLAAHHAAVRIGQGYLPGTTYTPGSYVNGRRVTDA